MLPRTISRIFNNSNKSIWNLKFAHSDIQFPNFDKERHDSTKDPHVKSSDNAVIRKATSSIGAFGKVIREISGKSVSRKKVDYFLNIMENCVTGLAGMYGFKSHLLHYVKYMSASKDVLAIATTEVSLSNVPEGNTLVAKWRGKPVFIFHRSQATIDQERNMNISSLRDPETDEARVKKSNWLVVIGVCTHLGCVPIPNAGMIPGGFYCPCHGSHYDAAGRIRKGPAPTNLEVPDYKFLDDQTILIG